ncbi:MAG TPA: hypothetical protein VJQ47_05095 [Steroidobacteraceae bacterium]|nr:hypothetical protein [Steroidobacteraceae bacterium]
MKDPVCGKDVNDQKIDAGEAVAGSGAPVTDPSFGTKRFHEGQWHYFCSMSCRQRFIANPARYLKRGSQP